ncbi:MAG TPA: WYL domain-containing transcriptional regulator [bacterium]|nr:WYL domain-containing transcriptional regulator [bacterium]
MESGKSILIWKLLNLIDSDRRFGVDGLAKELEVSRRSAFRYLRTIEAAGFPIFYDRREKRYRFPDGYSLKKIELSDNELNTLFVSSQYFKLLGNSFKQDFDETRKKIGGVAGGGTLRRLKKPVIPFIIKAEPIEDSARVKDCFDMIVECYASGVVAELDYETMWSGKRRVREVEPYGLVHYDGRLFLIGRCRLRNEVRTFSFEGIHGIKRGRSKYTIPEVFDLERHLRNALGVDYGDGEIYRARIRIAPEAVKLIRYRKWHESQKVTYEKDGSAVLSFKLAGKEEILRWLMGWADNAEILEPRWLREAFVDRIKRMGLVYKD